MIPALILWTFAIAAMLFVALALDRGRRGGESALVVALALTALWALAVAGLGAEDVAAAMAEGARDLGWLGAMLALVRRGDRNDFGPGRSVAFSLAACLPVLLVVLALADAVEPRLPSPVEPALRLLIALAGLILLQASVRARAPDRSIAALAMFWGVDLFLTAVVLGFGSSPGLTLARGVAVAATGAAFALAAGPRTGRSFGVSRDLGLGVLAAAALLLYLAIVAAATGVAAAWSGEYARVVQTAIVVGAAATLFALLSTPWLRAWTRVTIEKNLFGHRYDYRTAWARFTGTLGRPGEDGPLGQRVVQAVADLIDAPAGLLLVGEKLAFAAGWRWTSPTSDGGERLARHLEATGRIVDLDAVRAIRAPAEETATVPGWMVADADAWAVVPLIHGSTLVGAILLARPPVARALDWEDFDLLRLAGRQAASYLAEDRAHAALADAERFDEFNRRFAFILHDIKNLVSQISLVARNAERHADNPEFRADMIATLQDSAGRMTALVARLSNRPARGMAPQPVDLCGLLERMAHARRVQHPLIVQCGDAAVALADPAALEQILGHLVQNAVEASLPGAPVTLSACTLGDQVLIEVGDRGSGMSPAFVRDQLFRPFSSSKQGGFGLGAFEARELARAMGGTIAVDSREGEGTRFTVALPAAPSLDQAA